MQNVAWILSLALMAVIAGIFLWAVAGASRSGGDAGKMAETAYQWRGRLFWLVIVAGVAVTFLTLKEWPIAGHASAAPKPDVVIQANGHQFRWELDRDTVQTGQLVEFQLTSKDVNHGFAVYKDKNTLLAQAQAMPGYTNKLQIRFAEPGDYEVLCLEYCGIAHHGMRAVIKVSNGS